MTKHAALAKERRPGLERASEDKYRIDDRGETEQEGASGRGMLRGEGGRENRSLVRCSIHAWDADAEWK